MPDPTIRGRLADRSDWAPARIPAGPVARVGKERRDADLRLGLVPEDLDPAVLAKRGVVERHRAKDFLGIRSAHPEPHPEIFDHVHGGQGHHRDDEETQAGDDELIRARPQSWSPGSDVRATESRADMLVNLAREEREGREGLV